LGRTATGPADLKNMTYSVKEMFYTIQGEGCNAGRVAVFCRFSGCNLWSGLEKDRTSAICQFCDTNFVGTDGIGGGKFHSAADLADKVAELWNLGNGGKDGRFIVCTGGEPLLQIDEQLVTALHARGFFIAVETNGTKQAPKGIDWITVSPKSNTEIVLTTGDELKLVYPQLLAPPEHFVKLDFDHFFLQPMDGLELAENMQKVISYCHRNPKWRVSVQTHKILGIP
jgi:7-carboxy-7-deazaguanine synthase